MNSLSLPPWLHRNITIKRIRQVFFGAAVAAIYAILLVSHIVYGLFIALALTSATRALALYENALWKRKVVRKPQSAAEVSAAVSMAS
jgi:hypothetical protein